MIKYVIRKTVNPTDRTSVSYRPQKAGGGSVGLAQIARRIEKRSTVSSADAKAVLDALQYEVIETLKQGDSVRLGDLGSFCTTLSASGADTAAEAKAKGAELIRKVNVQFRPSVAMRDELSVSNVEFAAQEDVRNAAD